VRKRRETQSLAPLSVTATSIHSIATPLLLVSGRAAEQRDVRRREIHLPAEELCDPPHRAGVVEAHMRRIAPVPPVGERRFLAVKASHDADHSTWQYEPIELLEQRARLVRMLGDLAAHREI